MQPCERVLSKKKKKLFVYLFYVDVFVYVSQWLILWGERE